MTDPTADAASAGDDDLAYLDALDELEAILDRLERNEPDVDRVAEDVARAAALIAHCRCRIADARLTVDEVVAGLAAPSDDRPASGDPDEA
jgi:exodeoxyribonuclease VII small subunit